MPFPQQIDPTTPLDTDSPSQGAAIFRSLKQFNVDMFGVQPAPATIAGPPFFVDTTGQSPSVARLLNNSGGGLVAGDVVALDSTADRAVTLSDVANSILGRYVVALEAIAAGSTGRFGYAGVVTANITGTVNRGDALAKSATTKTVQTTVTGPGVLGWALTAGAAGKVTALWQAIPPQPVSLALPASVTPPTPPAQYGTLYSPIAAPALQAPAWLDSAGQVMELPRRMFSQLPIKQIFNTGAATSVFSAAPVIKGNSLATPRVLRVLLVGQIANSTGANASFNVILLFGGFAVVQLYDTFSTGTNQFYSVEYTLQPYGSTQLLGMLINRMTFGLASTSDVAPALQTVNLAVDQTLDVTVAPSVASSNLAFYSYAVQGILK